jgi:putative transposase
VLSPQAAEAIVKLRLQQPSLAISTLVRQLQESGVLQPGTFSLSSIYRLLVREGLDRPRLIAEGSGPTKAFETELANALWMADVMDGPTLRVGDRAVHTFLFALLDDCSRLVPPASITTMKSCAVCLIALKRPLDDAACRRSSIPIRAKSLPALTCRLSVLISKSNSSTPGLMLLGAGERSNGFPDRARRF